jgi:hypothetical protein
MSSCARGYCTASPLPVRIAIAGNGLVLDNEPAMQLIVDDRPVALDPGATVLDQEKGSP